VQCYRRLIEREFIQRKTHPAPHELATLLKRHIFGVDMDEDACSVAEFSLYLTLLDYVKASGLEEASALQTAQPSKTKHLLFRLLQSSAIRDQVPLGRWQPAVEKADSRKTGGTRRTRDEVDESERGGKCPSATILSRKLSLGAAANSWLLMASAGCCFPR
jgi:hypothetical protein